MKLSLFKFVNSSWETARGYLLEDLTHIESAINRWAGQLTDNNNNLLGIAIQGDPTVVPQYVTNEGLDANSKPAPKWGLVDLIAGVKNRLQFSHLKQATAGSVVLGRESGSAGDFEQLTLGPGLSITGTVLDASGTSASSVYAIVSLRA